MVRNLLTWIFIAVLGAALAAPLRAKEDTAAQSDFFREGESARTFGMGNAFVGLSDDVSAIYWNPAGLARLPGAQVLTTRTNLEFFESDIQTLSAAMPYGNGAIGFSYSAANTEFPIFGTNPSNPNRINYPTGVASEKYSGFSLAYAMPYGNNMYVGFSFKSLKYDLFGNTASGSGFDLGALMALDDETSVGVNLQNIGGVSLGEMDEVPMNISFGASKKFMGGSATVAAAYETDYLGESGFGVGMEYLLADYFTMRMGSYSGDTAYGFSIDYQGFRFDYALNSGSDETETNKFTVMKTFDVGNKAPKGPSKEEIEAQKKAEEAQREKEAEKKKKKEEAKKKREEEKKKKAEAKKKKEAEKKKKEEEKKKKEEEERKKKEEESKKEQDSVNVGVEPAGVNEGDEGKAWFEREEYYENERREQVKLPSVNDVIGPDTTSTTSESTIILPRPEPERFPSGQGGNYTLSNEYEGQIF